MAEPQREIAKFREIVDDTIHSLNGGQFVRSVETDTLAYFGDYVFVSVEESNDHPLPFPRFEGHAWGVIARNRQIGRINRYAGDVAIVSTTESDATLRRSVGIRSPLGSGTIQSHIEIADPEDIKAAVMWAASPQTRRGVAERLGQLSPEELADVSRQYASDSVKATALRDAVYEYDMFRRQAGEGPY